MPIRVAHPSHPGLDYLDDAYFALLRRCGYEGLYLQDSPFDSFTGNAGPFKASYHLISLLSGLKALETQLIFEVRLIEFRGMLSKSLQNGGFLEEGDAQNL